MSNTTTPKRKIAHEHDRFFVSMFVYVLTSQTTMVVDAAVGGNLLGADAVSAVDLVMPVYDIFYALTTLLGMGACTVASMAYGRGDVPAVRRHFTGAVVSALAVMLLLGGAIYLFDDELVRLLCGGSRLQQLTHRYLVAIVPFFVVAGVQIIGMTFTAMTGHPTWVMCCSIAQFVVNLTCNLLLIKVGGLGIEALACSSLISSAVGLALLLPVYLKKDCPFRLLRCPTRQLLDAIRVNIRYGSGFLMANAAYIVMTYSMNRLMLQYSGEQGLFCWSVVIMLFLTGGSASSTANTTSISLGGRYLGAGDLKGASRIYNRSLLFAVAWIGLLLAAVFLLPRTVLPLFGATDEDLYPTLLPFIALAIPFIAGTIIVNLFLIRLVQLGHVGRYTLLSSLLYLSLPVLFVLTHVLLPGHESCALLILLPIQIALILTNKSRLSLFNLH